MNIFVYDKLWGPSQGVVTLFKSVIGLFIKMLKASTQELLSPSTNPTLTD